MKKLSFIMITVFVILLTGCVKEEIKAGEDEIKIAVDISGVSDDLYRLDISYFLSDELMGGQAVSHADQTKLKGTYAFTFESRDFPEGSSLDDFSFQITLSGDKNGITDLFSSADLLDTTDHSRTFQIEYGKVYRFKVTGSFADGFSLTEENQ